MASVEVRLRNAEAGSMAELERIRADIGRVSVVVGRRMEERHKRPLIRLLRAIAAGTKPAGDWDAMRAAWAHFRAVATEEELQRMCPLPGQVERMDAMIEGLR